jgi:ABC-type Fe3+-hydroxamate transport system substrate-binding protein/adenosylcobinamide amidohydrolase
LTFTDDTGKRVTIKEQPQRVVSLVPSITEIICEIGAGETISGITYYDNYPSETAEKAVVGGFLSPSLTMIEECNPQAVFASDLHGAVKEQLEKTNFPCAVITLSVSSLSDLYDTIMLLGRIFDREYNAERLVNKISKEIDIVSRKVDRIPSTQRKRVIRLMGRNEIMTPGDDSFQNEYIRLAGGIPPILEKKGSIVPVTEKEWNRFNPEVIYGCGGDRLTAERFFNRPEWNNVGAVKRGSIYFFPCELTCRMSTRAGTFVAALASHLYRQEFSDPGNQVIADGIRSSRPLSIDLDYIEHARIAYAYCYDFLNKTLIITFRKPLEIVSTLEGQRKNIRTIGNHYSSPPCWGIEHAIGFEAAKRRFFSALDIERDDASFLFTGADMDNLAIEKESYRDMMVYALVTAGVMGNAMKASGDSGGFYEPGTVNMIIMTNMKLSPRAMTRSIISATEAKSAALSDLDIRSSYTARFNQATGTGTDNIIVASGEGRIIENAGGHTKMGELISRAVYHAVRKAVFKQNGVIAGRTVFARLRERNVSVSDLSIREEVKKDMSGFDLRTLLEKLLLEERYATFMLQAMALSDASESGLTGKSGHYRRECRNIAEEIAGETIPELKKIYNPAMPMPVILERALNALLNGIYYREVARGALNQ